MIKNIGQTDKIIRVIIALVLAGLDFFEVVKGGFSWVLSLIAVALLVTVFIGHCPLYKLLGKSTCEIK